MTPTKKVEESSPPSVPFFTAARVLTESKIKEFAEKARNDIEAANERMRSLIMESDAFKRHVAYAGPASPSAKTVATTSLAASTSPKASGSSVPASSASAAAQPSEEGSDPPPSSSAVPSTEEPALWTIADDESAPAEYSFSNPPPTFLDFLNYVVPPSSVIAPKDPPATASAARPRRAALGKVRVEVHRVCKLPSSRFYIDCAVENNVERGPDIYEMGLFRPKEHRFELDATDFTSTVRVRCYDVHVLSADKCVGQICVPLRKLFPSLSGSSRSTEKTASMKPTWHVLYPLDARHEKFVSAKKKLSHSGMKRPTKPCGYLQISIQVIPDYDRLNDPNGVSNELLKRLPKMVREDWVSASYVVNPAYAPRTRSIVAPTAPDVARTIRHFKRQDMRIFSATRRMMSPQFSLWRSFFYARSFRNPHFSMGYFSLHAWMALRAPVWLVPLILFGWVLAGAFLSRNDPSEPVLVWRDQVSDPDDALNPLQLMSKVLWMVESTARVAGSTADSMERGLHALSFRDERATVTVLLLLFAAASLTSLFLLLVPLRWAICAGFVGLGAQSLARRRALRSSSPRSLSDSEREAWLPEWLAAHVFKGKERCLEFGAIAEVWLRAALQVVVNVLSRLPTSEELAHEQIAATQVVSDESLIRELNESSFGTG